MERPIDLELKKLKEQLLCMAGEVEQQLSLAVRSLVERDSQAAQEVIAADERVDRREKEVDHTAVEIIVRERPLASDLRLVITATKIAPDLERVGDHAVNIAEQALVLNRMPPLKPFVTLPRMADIAKEMVRQALTAYIEHDASLARQVIVRDDVVDALHEEVFRELLTYMLGDPQTIPRALALILISRSLERIADQATNIAEQVVYLVEGQDIRHVHGGEDAGAL
ncbi:MAG: phosphate signaling complex protein PhoU [Thermoanaerobaculum sp.]